MKALAAKGIILKRLDYGEADRIITFLTDEYGKIRVIAKGVRKQKSKMAGGVELFSVSELQFIKGKGDIDTLMSTRLIEHYGDIVKDLSRTELAYSMLKTIDKTVEDHTGQDYFTVLLESLASLGTTVIPPILSELSFAMRVLQLLGNIPEFTSDSAGNRLSPDDTYEFHFESVSFMQKPDGSFDKNHLKVLKLLAYNSPQALASVQGIEGYCADIAPLIRSLRAFYVPS